MSIKTQEEFTAWSFIAPFVTGFIIFNFIPVILAVFISLMDFNSFAPLTDIIKGKVEFAGIKNYIRIFGDPIALNGYVKSFWFTIIYVPVVMVLSLTMAIMMNGKFYWKTASRTMIMIPYVTNIVAVAVIFSLVLDPVSGPVNVILKFIGIENPPNWLGNAVTALPSLAFVNAWHNLSYQSIIFLAALQSISSDLYEASIIDGANAWGKFKNVTLPGISPTTFFLMVTSLINSFKNFAIIRTMTDGGPGTATRVSVLNIYEEAFYFHRYSYASAQAIMLFFIIFIITIIQWKGQKKWVSY